MKHHSPVLCGAAAAHTVPTNKGTSNRRTPPHCANRSDRGRSIATERGVSRAGASVEELEGLLVALEAEFGRLS